MSKWLAGIVAGVLGVVVGWWWRGIWEDDPAEWPEAA
jgi:hypothetical protein